jgi:hypothetical protein
VYQGIERRPRRTGIKGEWSCETDRKELADWAVEAMLEVVLRLGCLRRPGAAAPDVEQSLRVRSADGGGDAQDRPG